MSLSAIRIFNHGQVVKSILGFKTKSALLDETESAFWLIEQHDAETGEHPA